MFFIYSRTVLLAFVILFTLTVFTNAMDYSFRADNDAPIGVMGNHTHMKGGVMFSYRYMFMKMEGMRDGTSGISNSQVLEQFMVTPTDMDIQRHMFGAMYALTVRLTLTGMIPYIKKSMNHLTRSGTRFRTDSEGFGDIKAMGLFKLFNRANHNNLILNFGLSFPTRSIDKKDDTPIGPDQQLPYPMQLGSGTWDLLPGVTYNGRKNNSNWGGQVMGVLRLGENDRDYTLGNRLNLTAWTAYNINYWFSGSFRLDWGFWGNIDGADPDLNPAVVPTADTDLTGGNRLDALIGINFVNKAGPKWLRGQRLAAEFGIPIYQDLDGPQLETDWVLMIEWQYALKLY